MCGSSAKVLKNSSSEDGVSSEVSRQNTHTRLIPNVYNFVFTHDILVIAKIRNKSLLRFPVRQSFAQSSSAIKVLAYREA